MLITCPSCTTNFSIPDSALGASGRKLKCAKCGHKWFQEPLMVMDEDDTDFDLGGSSFSAPPPMGDGGDRRIDLPSFDDPPVRDDDFGSLPVPGFGASRKDPLPPFPSSSSSSASDLDDDDAGSSLLNTGPQPIPDVFSTSRPDEKKGTGFLWFLLVLLVLGGLGGAGYYFQDQLVEAVPEAGEMLAQAGLRREKPGAGLELRKAGTPERFVHNDTDVLVVRGIIANITDRVRPVPTMKLVLMDKNKQPVQEKQSQPPVSALDPQGTASFKIMLERPDPSAVEVVVVFVESGEAKPMPPPAPKPLAPPPVPDVPPPAPAPVQATPAPTTPANGATPAPAATNGMAPATPVPGAAVPAPAPAPTAPAAPLPAPATK